MRVLGYVRQSKTADGSESIATQRDVLTAAAERQGVELVGLIVEPPSTGAFRDRGRNRPEFPKLLTALAGGEVDGVLAYKTDRLSRGGGPGWAPLFDAAEAGGLALDRFVLTPDGFMSEFEISIRAAMDREESKKTSDRVRDVKARDARNGRANHGGFRPFGYELDRVTVNETEAVLIRAAAEHLLSGGSLYSLVASWHELDVRTPRGNPWGPGELRRTLTNPRLCGQRVHKGEVVGRAEWPAIFDDDTGDRLRAMFKLNKSGNAFAYKRAYLLTGFLVCGRCGRKLIARRRADGVGSYMCWDPQKGACGQLRIVGPKVDDVVTGAILERLESADFAAELRDTTGKSDADAAALYEKLERDERRLEELAAALGEGAMSLAEWKIARDPVMKRIESAKSKLARVEREIVTFPIADLSEIATRWETLDLDQRRAVIAALVDSITIAPASAKGARFTPERVDIRWLL